MTSVFVTHDQEEAFEVADQVVVMNRGRVEQIGTPQQVFEQPANPFVMDFLGNVNVFNGRVQTAGPCWIVGSRLSRISARRAGRCDGLFSSARTRYPASSQRSAFAGGDGAAHQLGRFGGQGGSAGRGFRQGLNVEFSMARYSELGLKTGDRVFVSPRKARVFMPDYVI